MKKIRWKEIRNQGIPRRRIVYYWMRWELMVLKWYCFHLWYKLTKYEHKHIWTLNFKCLICRKYMRDIDYERLRE